MNGKALGTAVCIAVGLLVAWGASRGIPHSGPPPAWAGITPSPGPSPGPSAASSTPAAAIGPGAGGGGLSWWRLLAYAIFAAGALYAINRYFNLRHRRLTLEIAQVNGWSQVRRAELAEAWKCPGCRAWMSVTDIDHHQNRTACATYERWVIESGGEEGQPIRAKDVPWAVRESTTIPPDHSVISGGYDGINEDERGEIENKAAQ